MPTFAKLANAQTPQVVDGHDIWPLLSKAENANTPHQVLIHFTGGRIGAIRRGPWKLIPHAGKKSLRGELYDLSHDLGESNNVSVQHPELVKELTELGETTMTTFKQTDSP